MFKKLLKPSTETVTIHHLPIVTLKCQQSPSSQQSGGKIKVPVRAAGWDLTMMYALPLNF